MNQRMPIIAIIAVVIPVSSVLAAEPVDLDDSVPVDSAADALKKNAQSPWDLDPALETGLLVGASIGLILEVGFTGQNRGPWCGLACDPATVNPFDRTVIGWYNPNAARASDATLYLSIGIPFLAQAIDTAISKPSDGWKGYGKDVLVLAETLAVTAGITNFLKYTVGRARPFSYMDTLPDEVRLQRDAGLSFPSGHTSMAFAMATSWSWLYMKRHPGGPGVVPVWIGSYALAATTALLRPVAGKHYWTDIMAGAAIGIGVGLLVPWLHELVARKNRKAGDPTVILSPSVTGDGGGAVVTVIH